MKSQINWENLHSKKRFRPLYPAESIVRFLFTNFSHELNERKNIKIIDIGCGAGRHTRLCSEQGFNTYAVDFSKKGVVESEKLLADSNLKAQFSVADMGDLPFETETFDGAISFGVFYYTDSTGMKRAISEMYRVLKQGAKAIVVSRTDEDFRFNKGDKLEDSTFLLNNETNENNVVMHFINEKKIVDYYSEFTKVEYIKNDLYHKGLVSKGSNWIITLEK